MPMPIHVCRGPNDAADKAQFTEEKPAKTTVKENVL